MSLFSWLRNRSSIRSPGGRPHRRPGAPRFRPRLEALEGRALPSTYYAATASQLVADISAANKAGGANTIVLTAPTTSPYVLTAVNNTADKNGANGLPVIGGKHGGGTLTIQGNGDTIERSTASGTPAFRLFDVAGGGSLALQNVTLQDGLATGSGAAADGGAIYNQGTLVLSGVTVQFNTAQGSPGANAAGGGIWSGGSLTLENSSLVQGNSAVGGGNFATNAYGGGICIAGGTASITGTAFGGAYANQAEGNHAGSAYGGAVYVAGGTVTLSGDTVGGPPGPSLLDQQNVAQGGAYTTGYGYGGGICVAGGSVTLTHDVVEDNLAGYPGGGSYGGEGGGIFVAAGAAVSIDAFTSQNTYGNTPDNIFYG
jgi:hypothetical protein